MSLWRRIAARWHKPVDAVSLSDDVCVGWYLESDSHCAFRR